MGKLIYASGLAELEVEDRTLAHLKVVILTKLRRNECFSLSWPHGEDGGTGRSTVWIHPGMTLEFHFNGNRSPELNREWIDALLQSANSADGLRMIPESEVNSRE